MGLFSQNQNIQHRDVSIQHYEPTFTYGQQSQLHKVEATVPVNPACAFLIRLLALHQEQQNILCLNQRRSGKVSTSKRYHEVRDFCIKQAILLVIAAEYHLAHSETVPTLTHIHARYCIVSIQKFQVPKGLLARLFRKGRIKSWSCLDKSISIYESPSRYHWSRYG